MEEEIVLLRGIPVTEPEVYRRRLRPVGWREGLFETSRRLVSFSLSALAHILIALLLISLFVRVLPAGDGGPLTIGLKARSGSPAAPAAKEAEAPKSEAPVEARQPTRIGTGGGAPAVTEASEVLTPALSSLSLDRPEGGGGGNYGNRGTGRQGAVERFGGTAGSEEAVERALEWLARHQERSGAWLLGNDWKDCPADAPCTLKFARSQIAGWDSGITQNYPEFFTTGLTSLVLLAYYGAGYTHKSGLHAETVSRALKFVLKSQRPDHSFLSPMAGMMYEHGISTLMVSEAFGLTQDATLKEPLRKAVGFIVKSQGTDGGWGYQPNSQFEFTQSVWQIFALVSARKQGVAFPDSTLAMAGQMVRRATHGDGWVKYSPQERGVSSVGSLGGALFARMALGMPPDDAFQKTRRRVERDRYDPEPGRNGHAYFWYYKTLSLFQLQGEEWPEWNVKIREHLVDTQVKEGHGAGCWTMRDVLLSEPLPWNLAIESRVYNTTMAALILEVYYRYLPFYQLDRSPLAFESEGLVAEPTAMALPDGPSDADDEVERLLRSDSQFDRWLGAKKAGEERRKGLRPLMMKAVALDATDAAGALLEYVAQLGDDGAIPEIIPYLDDARVRVKEGARNALKTLAKKDLGEQSDAWRKWWKAKK